jgi:transcriptional regulator with XRE-family HTH domain
MTRARRHQFQNRLRKHRRTMGYSQKQVAWLLGHKNTSSLSRWEKGITMPTVDNLIKLAFLYRTLCDQLYFDLSLEYRQTLRQKEKQLLDKHAEM